jgi:hypothetical protein
LVAVLAMVPAEAMAHEGSSSAPAPDMTIAKKGSTKSAVRISSHPEAVAHVSTATFAFSSNYAKAKYVCSLDNSAYAACRTPKTYRRLADGAHSFAVKASVGGIFSIPARYRWTIATTPTVQIDSYPASPFTSLDATFTFSSDHIGATFRCSLDGAVFTPCYSPMTYGPLAKGSRTFAVKASAAALTSDPATFDWTIATSGGDVGSVPAALAAATTVGQAEQDLSLFFAQYHMTVAITNIQPSTYAQTFATWTPIGEGDLPALKAYGAALLDEWAKYPLDYVRVTRVSGIVLVVNLATFGTKKGAMPDIGGDVMYYDIGHGTDDYAREVIHHEFDHLLTYNLFGTFTPSDPTWRTLNPPGFHYGDGGASCYIPGNTCLSGQHPIPGFVSGYAASAIEEDKAELYANLMDTHFYRLLTSWIGSDSYLAAKVADYEQLLCSLSAAMCGDYFDAINRK